MITHNVLDAILRICIEKLLIDTKYDVTKVKFFLSVDFYVEM